MPKLVLKSKLANRTKKGKLAKQRIMKKPLGRHAFKGKVNAAFKKVHKLSYSGKCEAPCNVQLKRLDQIPYEVVQKMTQKQALQFLKEKGVLPRGVRDYNFNCHSCGGKLARAGKNFRCHKRKCRAWLRSPGVAFTPLFGAASAGMEIDYAMFLRVAYALGCKTPNDAAAHYVRREGQSTVAAEAVIRRLYSPLKIALAYKEVKRSQCMTFVNDIIEPDTTRTASKKKGVANPQMQQHHGRTLVVKSRFSKKWSALPLRARETKKGRGGGGPETLKEVSKAVEVAAGPGTVVSPDGAIAFKSAAQSAGRPVLQGVNHNQKIFTPVCRLLKSKLDARTVKMLRQRTKGTRPSVQENSRYFVMAGGDNSAEGTTGHLKNTMRRVGNLGRNNTSVSERKNVQALSAAALHRSAGFESVLEAVKEYREDLSSGVIRLSCKEAFKEEKCGTWLFAHLQHASD